MRGTEAIVEGAVLAWGRTSLNLDLTAAAKKIGVPPDRLEAWEKNEARPTVVQLRKLADVYKRPVALFFLPEPPKDFSPLKDFRGAHDAGDTPALRYAVRLAHERREIALDLARDVDFVPPTLGVTASVSDDPEAVGLRLRKAVGVSPEEQLLWTSQGQAFGAWRMALERAGVLVFETRSVEMSEARGFSLPASRLPVIVLNGLDAMNGRVFTMMHELAHIAVRSGGLCDMHDAGSSEATRLEKFCNRAAAAALIDRSTLLSHPDVVSKGPTSKYGEPELRRLAYRFRVSEEALLRRLVDLQKAPMSFYQAMRSVYFARVQLKVPSDSDGGPLPHTLALKYNGHLFTRLVLSAYERESITAGDAWDYLKIRPKHFSKLETDLRWRAA
jgi:Zn-dependent peptidase ImmA (M78 family)/transcriptional regulator with XRE-family HTH domain